MKSSYDSVPPYAGGAFSFGFVVDAPALNWKPPVAAAGAAVWFADAEKLKPPVLLELVAGRQTEKLSKPLDSIRIGSYKAHFSI